jgi:CelD/BcsL family acetyltransferase involved in cellulose biosynthesis
MNSSFFTLDELGLPSEHDGQTVGVCEESDESGETQSVFEINELATLAELQPLWHELLTKTPRPAFCQTFDWLQLYWDHFSDRQRLRVFCCERAGETVGLTALVEKVTRGRRELTLPSVGTETLAPLGRNSSWSWLAIGNLLRSELTRRHVLDLRGVADPQDRTLSALSAVGLPARSQPWTMTTVVPLDDDFSAFWSRASSPLQALVDVGEQRLGALGPTNFVRFRPQATERTPPQFPDELYQDCLNVALNDEKQLPRADSLLNAPERHLFLRDLLPWAWQHAAADLCLLLIGSRPVAFRFHTLMHGHLRTVWTGVDAEFRQLPLASLLLHRTLRDSMQRGDVELELGPTHADVARDWNGSQLSLRRIVAGAGSNFVMAQKPEEKTLNDN